MTSINWRERAEQTDLRICNMINGKAIPVEPVYDSANVDDPGQVISKHAPGDGQLLYRLCVGSAEQVDTAVANAREAYNDGRWSGLPLAQRQAVINKLADLVEEHAEQLALYESLDVGKTISKALNDDIALIANYLRSAANAASSFYSPSAADQGVFAYLRHKPLGVVAGITGWNFPLTLAASKIGPALIMGNSIVVKPSEYTSLGTWHLAELALEAGVPPGVFNVVNGAGHTVGDALARHPDINLLSFVGSSVTGKRLMVAAGESNMKRLILECGGKSPYLVFDDCPDDLDFVAQDIVSKAFPNQGALCIAGTRLLIQESMREKLLPKILDKTQQLEAGDPLDENTRFGALINKQHLRKVLNYIEVGIREGGELLCGGKQLYPQGERDLSKGYYCAPTIIDGVAADDTIAQEEIFGPVLAVQTFSHEEEAIAIANNSHFGLAAYAATTHTGRTQRLSDRLNAGLLFITGSDQSPCGGVSLPSDKHGQSGFGFSGGLNGLETYAITTTVYLSS